MQIYQATLPLLGCALLFGCASADVSVDSPAPARTLEGDPELGNFSVSLSVADLPTSMEFYGNLGFQLFLEEKDYVIMQNGTATIGLFHGMFEGNIMTFNPGWDRASQNTETFTDVREIQRLLDERGVALTLRADAATEGPASIMLVDPDGNTILIDQHR